MSKIIGEIVLLSSAAGEPFLGRVIGGDLSKLEVKFTNGAEDLVSAKDVTFIDKAEFLQLLADHETERQAEIAAEGDAYLQSRPRPYSGIARAMMDAAGDKSEGIYMPHGGPEEELAGPGELVKVKAARGRWSGRFGIVQTVEMNTLLVRLLTSEFEPVGSPVPLQHGDVEVYPIPEAGDEIIVTDTRQNKYMSARGIVQHSIPDQAFAYYIRLEDGPFIGNEKPIFTTMHRKEFQITKKKSEQ